MKKISEMTLEELQDYAMQLEEQNTQSQSKIAEIEGNNKNLVELNQALQKRNNDLFLKVEQSKQPEPEQKQPDPQPVESCEDFAKRLILGGE